MGAAYTVMIRLTFKNKESALSAFWKMREFLSSYNAYFHVDEYESLGVLPNSFDNIMRIVLAGRQKSRYQATSKGLVRTYISDFAASYGWRQVIIEAFKTVAPFVENGSKMFLDCDNDSDYFEVRGGKAIWNGKELE